MIPDTVLWGIHMKCTVEHDAKLGAVNLFAVSFWKDVANSVMRVNCSREIMACLMT